jgi:uncharacterized protein (UPF0335 family)
MSNLDTMKEKHGLGGGRAIQTHEIKSIVERVETHEKGRKEIIDNISKLYKEAKASGYDIKALRDIIRMRKMNSGDRIEKQIILETYMQAMGML